MMSINRKGRVLAASFFVVAAGTSAYLFSAASGPGTGPKPVEVAVPPEKVNSPWLTNIGTGLATAKREQRDALFWFTGGGYTGESQASAQVLSDDAFTSAAGKDFVLVRIQVSSGGDLKQSGDAGASVWADRLTVQQLPALVALDSRGKPYAINSQIAGNPAAAIRSLEAMKAARGARDQAFASAQSLHGADRARMLEKGVDAVRPFASNWYAETLQEIVDADPSDTTGLFAKYRPILTGVRLDSIVQSEIYPMIDAAHYAAAVERIDKLVRDEKLSTEQTQMMLGFKAQVQYSMGEKSKAGETLQVALALAPRSNAATKLLRAKEQFEEQ